MIWSRKGELKLLFRRAPRGLEAKDRALEGLRQKTELLRVEA